MGFLQPKTPSRPLDEGLTPSQIAEAERKRRLQFRGAASTTLAGNNLASSPKQASDQKTTLGGGL